MLLSPFIFIILIIALIGRFSGQVGGYRYGMGHGGIGIIGVIMMIVVALLLLGRR